MDMI